MRSLTLSLDLNDDIVHPMHAFIAADERYGPTQLLQWNPTDNGTNLMLFQITGPVEPYSRALDEIQRITSYEVISPPTDSDSFWLIVEDTLSGAAEGLISAYANEPVILAPPVSFHNDHSVKMRLVGSNSALSRLVNQLPDELDAEVERLTSGGPAMNRTAERLTDRQRQVLTEALDIGYYDEPRSATLEDVAEAVNLAVGTAAEHIRKAEATLVRYALGEQ